MAFAGDHHRPIHDVGHHIVNDAWALGRVEDNLNGKRQPWRVSGDKRGGAELQIVIFDRGEVVFGTVIGMILVALGSERELRHQGETKISFLTKKLRNVKQKRMAWSLLKSSIIFLSTKIPLSDRLVAETF